MKLHGNEYDPRYPLRLEEEGALGAAHPLDCAWLAVTLLKYGSRGATVAELATLGVRGEPIAAAVLSRLGANGHLCAAQGEAPTRGWAEGGRVAFRPRPLASRWDTGVGAWVRYEIRGFATAAARLRPKGVV